MNKTLIDLLKEELKTIHDAAEIMVYSYENCKKIGIKEDYSLSEADHFEAFTSRFARLSDIVIQKFFRLIDKIELEDEGTVRDRINRAEKKGLIISADTFVQIRIVRNDIAHEYHIQALRDIYKKTLELTPYILDSVERIKEYCKKYYTSETNEDES